MTSVDANIDPHDKVRARDVNKVARGEEAPRPARELGSIRSAPPKPPPTTNLEEPGTAPVDWRFLTTNQTRHCYIRYLEFHKCIQDKDGDAPKCHKFAKYYRSLCPSDWIESWNEQRANGTFPGPL